MASKWNIYDSQIKTELLNESNATTIAKKILTKNNITFDGFVTEEFARYIKRNVTRISDTNEGIYNACDEIKVDFTTAKNLWIKTKNKDGSGVSGFVVNPNYVPPIEEDKIEKEIDFLSIFKDKIKPLKLNLTKNLKNTALFDRLVFTDVHFGMDVNKDGFALYHGKWDEEEIFNRLQILIEQTILNQKSDFLFINELGDYMDGWDALTTRGGHSLPQNMDNQKAFDLGLKFKILLVDELVKYYKKIKFVNICNDNHAGSFGYVVNSAFKSYIELKYPDNAEVINQRRFIDHYMIENRCFILTHGKDDKSLKFGFKPFIDAVQIEKIKNYIDEYKIWGKQIEFSKGDSHQLILDFTSSSYFEYQNFGSFSPPSDWVKTNFKNTLSCFTMFNYYEEQKTINNYIFKKQ